MWRRKGSTEQWPTPTFGDGTLLWCRSLVHKDGLSVDANVVHAEVLDPQPGVGTTVWYPDNEKHQCFALCEDTSLEMVRKCGCQTRCWAGNRVQPRNAQSRSRS